MSQSLPIAEKDAGIEFCDRLILCGPRHDHRCTRPPEHGGDHRCARWNGGRRYIELPDGDRAARCDVTPPEGGHEI